MPIDDAHMAALHYGSKKNLEFEGETYDAPQFTEEQMKKANDARKWVLVKKHILSCDELTQKELFIKNGFEQKEYYNKTLGKTVKSKNWTKDPKSNKTPEQFSWDACFNSKKSSHDCLGYGSHNRRRYSQEVYIRLLLSGTQIKTI